MKTKQMMMVVFLIVWIVLFSCQETKEELLFDKKGSDITGIKFSNNLIDTEDLNIIKYLYYYNGGGLAAGDLNNDGWVDLVFTNNQDRNYVYINKGRDAVPMFEEIGIASGIGEEVNWSTGVTIIDINNDGLKDMYICEVGGILTMKGRNRLYINQGINNGIPLFKDETEQYGLSFQGLSTHAAFLDYDKDGDVDMYLMNHSVHASDHYAKSDLRHELNELSGDKLYKNDDGRFIEVTQESGIYSSKIGYGLGIDVGDLNLDGFPDLYIGNDFHENDYLYLNEGDGTFKEVIESSVGHTSQFSMGVTIDDMNNDLFPDIISLDMMPEDEKTRKRSVDSDTYGIYNFKKNFGYHYQLPRNTFQLSQGVIPGHIPLYSDISSMSGIDATDWSWSAVTADFDLDGLKDLFVSNGIVKRPNDLDYLNYIADPLIQNQAADFDMIKNMPDGTVMNNIFRNSDGLIFENFTDSWLKEEEGISTAAISVDIDNDGDLDIITNNINEKAGVYLNNTTSNSNLTVILKGSELNKDGIGAKVELWHSESTLLEEFYLNCGFMSSVNTPLVFGIGSSKQVDTIRVIWSDGNRQDIFNTKGGTVVTLDYKESIPSDKLQKVEILPVANDTWKQLPFLHIEDPDSDINAQKLMPWGLSRLGPAMSSGDVNGDGIEDLFLGGATGQSASILLGSKDGSFIPIQDSIWTVEAHFEDTDAVFFDADNDSDLDLFVCSGGNNRLSGSPLLLDRIYINDGSGYFKKGSGMVHMITENSSSVDAGDFDGDGDMDLVVGYNVYANKYGISPGANIFQNNGSGKFVPVTANFAPDLYNIGMVNEVQWADMDNDDHLDIVVTGEWMPIYIYESRNGRFEKHTIEDSDGLWNTLKIVDLDNDGVLDIVGGNFGLNSQLSQGGEAGLIVSDFDRNQIMDPIIYYKEGGEKHVLFGRDILASHMSIFRDVYQDYNSFSDATFEEMFDFEKFPFLAKAKATEFESSVYLGQEDFSFRKMTLPKEAQVGPVYAIEAADITGDGYLDLLMFGNNYNISPSIGRADAHYGVYLRGSKQGYEVVKGPTVFGQIRSSAILSNGDETLLAIGRNDDYAMLLKL